MRLHQEDRAHVTDTREQQQVGSDAQEAEARIRAAMAGDRAAFAKLVELYQRPIFNVCMTHLREEAEAMDVVQDTFVKAWTRREQYQADTNFRAWLFRIAANGCIDRIRRRKIRRADEIDERTTSDDLAEGDLPSVSTYGRASPLQEHARNQLGERLQKALATLPETMRQCVLLCDVHGYSYQEIADEMGIPKGTVMSRLFYARKKLQVELADFRD